MNALNQPTAVAHYQSLILLAVSNAIDPKLLEEQLKKVVYDNTLEEDPVSGADLTTDDLISMIMMHQFIAESVGLGDQLCTSWSEAELLYSFDYKSLRDMQTTYAYKIGMHIALTDELLKGVEQVAEVPVDKNTLAAYVLERSKALNRARESFSDLSK